MRTAILCVLATAGPAQSAAIGQSPAPPVTALKFVSQGRALLIGSQAGLSERTWPDLAHRRTIPVELQHIHDIQLSSDGRLLAVAGGVPAVQGEIVIVNWPDGTIRQRISTPDDVVYAVDWKPGSAVLAAASLDRQCRLFDAITGRRLMKFSGHSRGITCVTFLPPHNLLLTSGIDQSVRRWNLDSGHLELSAQNHTRPVHDLALRPIPARAPRGLPMVCTTSDDRTIRIWQPTIGRMVRFVRLKSTVALALKWTPDGRWIVASCQDGHLRVVDPDTAKVVQDTPGIAGWAYSLGIHPRGTHAVIGGQSSAIQAVKLMLPGDD